MDADHALLAELARAGGGRASASTKRIRPPRARSSSRRRSRFRRSPISRSISAPVSTSRSSPRAASCRAGRSRVLARTHHDIPPRSRCAAALGGEAFEKQYDVKRDTSVMQASCPALGGRVRASPARRRAGPRRGARPHRRARRRLRPDDAVHQHSRARERSRVLADGHPAQHTRRCAASELSALDPRRGKPACADAGCCGVAVADDGVGLQPGDSPVGRRAAPPPRRRRTSGARA